ncbi:nuclear transcription factor Y, gamma [Entomortierella parvispora]|uniref:Nuclear transcription factor Y, gamma n=1 Tax=Entomortierella parvispora TaxID=205924 RepID=A0A9P3HL94_9FUNG|nr:nuclear transcription factor Y, gamma [Entomortierella parvispora]
MYESQHHHPHHSSSSSATGVGITSTNPVTAQAQTQAQVQQVQGSATLQQQQQFALEFWEEQIVAAEQFDSDFKNHPLPLARIKKVMKSDPEVKMISAEAPILFSKACEIFICEITRRAWLNAEENKRRTLQRSDVASAVSRSDQFDFLIDIVPREEPPKMAKRSTSSREDPAPEPEAYEDQQQQQQQQQPPQQYASYYPQGPGGLTGYPHAIDPQFYQAVSHDQFQQYIQYQQAAAYQAQQHQHQQQQHHAGSAGAGAGAASSPSGSAAGDSRSGSVGYDSSRQS